MDEWEGRQYGNYFTGENILRIQCYMSTCLLKILIILRVRYFSYSSFPGLRQGISLCTKIISPCEVNESQLFTGRVKSKMSPFKDNE